MRIRRLAVALTFALSALAFTGARADVLVRVDKSTQTMTVSVDGVERYTWKVSTGRADYDTPGGDFKPNRMDKDHYSEEWDNAPMPYSIFFDEDGHAIHGTYEAKHLGQPVSHGCVRLSVKNAAILWDLIKHYKMANTHVELTGEISGGSRHRRDHARGAHLRRRRPAAAQARAPPQRLARSRGWLDGLLLSRGAAPTLPLQRALPVRLVRSR